jgi:hypothetical protein
LAFVVGVPTEISFLTLPAPATATAFASTCSFSLSERTGPLNVTFPCSVITLTLCADDDSFLSEVIACRICFVMPTSDLSLDC